MTYNKSFRAALAVLFLAFSYLPAPVPLLGQADSGSGSSCKVMKDADGLRHLLTDCRYRAAAGIKVVTFKKDLTYGYELSLNPALIAAIRRHPGSKLMVPEGGGVFHTDDPTGRVRDGEWTALYDYGLDIWREGQSRPMFDSVYKAEPELFEQALRSYHDRVVAAGRILIQPVLDMKGPGKQQLEEGLLATSGDMLGYCNSDETILRPAPGIPSLLKLKKKYPALFQNSARRRVTTNQDATVYAPLRSSADGSERILTVFNFSSQPIFTEVDTRAIPGSRYRNLEPGEVATGSDGTLSIELSGYGHRPFRLDPQDTKLIQEMTS